MDIQQSEYNKPYGSKFFYGETVRHIHSDKLYTVCDLSNYENDYYGLWPLGYNCAVPTHGSYGEDLESISEELS